MMHTRMWRRSRALTLTRPSFRRHRACTASRLGELNLPRWSKLVGDLVDGSACRFVLVGEAFGEFATVALALLFELDEVADTYAAVASDAVRNDLASIKEFVQVRAAHAQSLGNLGGRLAGQYRLGKT